MVAPTRVTRWVASDGDDDQFRFGCYAEWVDDAGVVYAAAGSAPPAGVEVLSDDEFVDRFVAFVATAKQRHDNREQAARSASLLAVSAAESDRAALEAAGIPAEVAARMVEVPRVHEPSPWSLPDSWEEWAVATFYLSDELVGAIKTRLLEV